jgi:hypothetical protein
MKQVSRLRATGEIGPDTKATTVRFDDGESGVASVVGIVQAGSRTAARGQSCLSLREAGAETAAVRGAVCLWALRARRDAVSYRHVLALQQARCPNGAGRTERRYEPQGINSAPLLQSSHIKIVRLFRQRTVSPVCPNSGRRKEQLRIHSYWSRQPSATGRKAARRVASGKLTQET